MTQKQKLLIIEYCLQHPSELWSCAVMGILMNSNLEESKRLAVEWLEGNKE